MQHQPTGESPEVLNSEMAQAKQLLIDEGNQAFDDDAFERALDCFHRASLIDGSDAQVWNLLGLTYTNLEFNQEAWRSYKLALQADPDNLDALWYSGEFLFGIEDMALTNLVLTRYLELEEDDTKREEAIEMLKEARLSLGGDLDEGSPSPKFSAEDYDLADEADDSNELEGFEIEGDESSADGSGLEDDDSIDDEVNGSYEDMESTDDEEFVAHLSLQLEVADSKCNGCMTPLPKDAPYCYSCKAPHFYENR